MKSTESYSAMIKRLDRAGVKQQLPNGGADRKIADEPLARGVNPAAYTSPSGGASTFDSGKVANIRLQIGFGIYHTDLERLAEKLLGANIF